MLAARFFVRSAHYDHSLGKTLLGQQVVTLGLAADDGFLPLEPKLTAVLRMKRGNLKYCVRRTDRSELLLDANDLYVKATRGKWRKVAELPWRLVSHTVQLNLENDAHKPKTRAV